MNRRMLVALLALPVGAAATAQSGTRVDTSSVLVTSGVGEVSVTPDRAILRIDVSTRDTSASTAAVKNGARLRRVLDSLNAIRLPDESIQVVAVSVRPNENTERGEVVGYEASGTVRVALRTLDRLGAILDAALRTGATGIDDVEFHSDRESAVRRDALARAYVEARANAVALAKAAGVELGPLLRLATEPEGGSPFRGYYGLSSVAFRGSSEMQVAPRDITVTMFVHATWRLTRARR